MSTAELPRSMNEAHERDPHNNNSYGTLVDREYLGVSLPDRLADLGVPMLRRSARDSRTASAALASFSQLQLLPATSRNQFLRFLDLQER